MAHAGGRPKIEFDQGLFEELCSISCTKIEIASVLKMSEDTLEKRVAEVYGSSFTVAYKSFQGTGKQSLRRMQLLAAQKGNVSMLIWLGKQWLGQSDQPQSGIDDKPPMKIHINGKPEPTDLDLARNDNLEISLGKASE